MTELDKCVCMSAVCFLSTHTHTHTHPGCGESVLGLNVHEARTDSFCLQPPHRPETFEKYQELKFFDCQLRFKKSVFSYLPSPLFSKLLVWLLQPVHTLFAPLSLSVCSTFISHPLFLNLLFFHPSFLWTLGQMSLPSSLIDRVLSQRWGGREGGRGAGVCRWTSLDSFLSSPPFLPLSPPLPSFPWAVLSVSLSPVWLIKSGGSSDETVWNYSGLLVQ